jgi:hypothetical protein
MAMVAEARPAESDREYEAALAFANSAKTDTPTKNTVERFDSNSAGHQCWMYFGDATSAKGEYAFGVSLTRVRGKAVILLFEGHYRLQSEAGHAQEVRAFRSQAEPFLRSVR